MDNKEKITQLDAKIESTEKELNKITEKRTSYEKKEKELADKIKILQNEKSACQMEDINISLNEKGLKLEDIMNAIKTGNVQVLQSKIQKNNN